MNLYKINKNNLTYERISIWDISKYVLLIALIFSGFGFTGGVKITQIIEKIPVIIRAEEEEFNQENLIKEIKKIGFKYPDIILAQAILETDSFRSSIFKYNGNLFGMKVSHLRPSTATCKNREHAVYNTWQESVIDRAMWDCMYLNKIKSEKEYLQLLGEFYAEDDLYVSKLKQLIR